MAKKNKDKKKESKITTVEEIFKDRLVDLPEPGSRTNVEYVSTGLPMLDTIVKIPRGRIVELYGFESSFKTSTAITMATEFQKYGDIVYLDAEYNLDEPYCYHLGMDPDKMHIARPNSLDDALNMIFLAFRHNFNLKRYISCVVLDSITGLATDDEIEDDSERAAQAAQAIGKFLKKVSKFIHDTKGVFIFTNQMREKLMTGNPRTSYYTPGGRSKNFYASIRMRLATRWADDTSEKWIREANHKIIKYRLDKDKTGGNQDATTEVLWTQKDGPYWPFEHLQFAVQYGLLELKGSWFHDPAQEKNIANGKKAMLEMFEQGIVELKKDDENQTYELSFAQESDG